VRSSWNEHGLLLIIAGVGNSWKGKRCRMPVIEQREEPQSQAAKSKQSFKNQKIKKQK
jgi:hypothetical protein